MRRGEILEPSMCINESLVLMTRDTYETCDIEDGNTLNRREVGDICVKSHHVILPR